MMIEYTTKVLEIILVSRCLHTFVRELVKYAMLREKTYEEREVKGESLRKS